MTVKDRLQACVAALEGPRHRLAAPAALGRAADYVAGRLLDSGFPVEDRPVEFAGTTFRNVVATRAGANPGRPRVLVGAHYDTMPGTPGADDNASGVAAMLEAARLLADDTLEATVEFAAFTLEEPQGLDYGVGSRTFAREARQRGVRYAGALILEMVGYTDPRPAGQEIPLLLRWKRFPRTGTFLAAAADGRSGGLLRDFTRAARDAVPELELVTVQVPFNGWLVPQTRLSDNRSFWDAGYPALMLTDTAFLRNPHYHQPSDRLETLDFGFMAQVTDAVVATVRLIAGGRWTPGGESGG
jgi:Zn-dependent M28 family amino/carboxypeptidase